MGRRRLLHVRRAARAARCSGRAGRRGGGGEVGSTGGGGGILRGLFSSVHVGCEILRSRHKVLSPTTETAETGDYDWRLETGSYRVVELLEVLCFSVY